MTIYIGLDEAEKEPIVRQYAAEHGIRNTVVISPAQRPLVLKGADNVEWAETIMYRTFYRLLQEIQDDTLIVLSEPLRTQNRYELTYNCIRNFLNQTRHQLIFQHLPQIDTCDDFMILFDFDTRSRWKRRSWDIDLVRDNTQVLARPVSVEFIRIDVPTAPATKARYRRERERLFTELGKRDPHTIPRNLYLIGGKDKVAYIDSLGTAEQPSLFIDSSPALYVARNQRLNRPNVATYAQVKSRPAGPAAVVEFPHRFIDFSDFIWRTRQTSFPVLVADLKIDHWYFDRYTAWKERIDEIHASLQQ